MREKQRCKGMKLIGRTKRLLSVLLCVCMTLTLIPVTVKAEGTVATPTFSVMEGTEFSETQEITITCDTDGATIFYTLDGSTPSSTTGKVYTGSITISVTSTVKAIAVKDGMTESEVASATYKRTDVQLSGYCGKEGDNLTWVIDNSGTLTISGQGEMVDEPYGIWYMNSESKLVKKIVIQPGVTSLGENAFRNCKLATEITIPDTVTSIGERAFQNCKTITNITIPASVTSIGKGITSQCLALETITVDTNNSVYKAEGSCIIKKDTNQLIAGCKNSSIPNTVTSIGEWAFYGISMTSIELPNSITSIEYAAFCYSGLTSITFPSSLKQIGDYAFDHCTTLASVEIPDSVESIGCNAFASCSALDSITLSSSGNLKSIGQKAFGWCNKITSITIPASVESLGTYCFISCTALDTVTIADNSKLQTIGDRPFYNCNALTTITMNDNGIFYAANNCLFEKNEDGSVKRLVYGFEVTLPTDEGYTVAAEDGNGRYVGRNGSFSFTVTPAAGYNKNVVVKANSSSLTAGENGVYTISNITANQTVTLEGAGECTHEGAIFSQVENNTKHKCSLCDKVLEHRFEVDGEHPEQHKCSDCGYAEAHTGITYQADDSAHIISASCSGCGNLGTITLVAPTGDLSYTGVAKAVTVSDSISGITTPDITYVKSDGTNLGTTAPTDAGTYTASITLGEGDGSKTVSVTYEITKAAAGVGTAPSAKPDLTYNGNAQALVTEGSATAGTGTLQYSTSKNGAYSTNIPTGTDAKEYSVWYKVVGDDNHSDTTPVEIKVTIAPLTITNDNTTINLGTPLTYTGTEQTQSIASVTVGTLILEDGDYTVSNNTGTDARNDYVLTVNGTGNFTGTATKTFSISKKSLTGTNQTLLVKKNQVKDITYDLSKLLPEGVTGTTNYAVGTVTNDNGVLSPAPTVGDITDGKLTLHVASVASADQIATVQITFTNSNYDISATTLTVKTTDKTLVTLSGVTCGNRAYNGTAYAYTGTPVWNTAEGEIAAGETTVTYYKSDDPSTSVEAPANAGSYRAEFTITSEDYVGTESYSFEITKAEITVAAKDRNIYTGDTVPDLTNPKAGTDYTVTGLYGTDAVSGTAIMSYGRTPDNTKAGTYEILISGLTAPEGDNYTITFAKGTLKITTKPSGGGGSSSGGSSGGGSGSGGSTGEVTTGKDSGSNVTTTTSPTEVKVENGTASATVKAANVTEAIKQAADNKSAEIVFTVSEKDTGNADNIQLTMTTSDVKQILDKTDADLVVATTAGDVILPQEALKEAVSAAGGNTITIEIDKVTTPTAAQKEAAGENSYIVEVTITSQNKAITTFGGNTLRIRLEIPAALVGKDVAVIHIAEDGKTEKMPGKTVTEGTKQYYEFTTTHLSTFALVDSSIIEEETPAVTAPKKGTLLTDSKTKMVYKVTKSGTTGGTVQFVKTKNTKAKTVAIPDKVTIDGITYKVTSIAANVLKNNKTVTTVTIGKYVTSIGSNAFYGCSKLKKVTIGKSVTTIGSKAFYKCTSLTSITIPSKVTKIGNYAFKGCTKLKTIKINTTLLTTKTVSEYAFSGVSTSAVVKVPRSKNKTYKKLLVKKGLSKKVTIKNL